MLLHIIVCGIVGALDRPLEGIGIGAAVALEDQAFQAQQAGAVVAFRIELLERLAREHRAQHRHDAFLERGLHEARQAFDRLEHDVADETVAHDDVDRALEDVIAFDIAEKVQFATFGVGAQQHAGGFHRLIALDVFGADVEQADGRARDALDRRTQHRAHDGELVQVVRLAVDVGAEVEDIGRAALLVRHDRADRRAVDAGHGLEHVARDGHQGAGIAGRDAGVGAAILDGLDRHPHRRILLAAQGHFDRVFHRDDFGSVLDGQARVVVRVMLLEFCAQHIFDAHEHELGVSLLFEKGDGCRNGN